MNKRRLSKSAKIRRALAQDNMSPAAIAAKYNASIQTVYTLKSLMRKEGKLPRRETTIINPSEQPAEPGKLIPLPPTATITPSGIITLSEPMPVPPGGITYVSPAAPTATVEVRPSLWARFKLWAFGAR